MVRACRGLLVLFLLSGPPGASAVTIVTVTDSTDTPHAGGCATTGTGLCSLRDAINFANAGTGATIQFSITGGGLHSIALGSPLPTITQPVLIDGYTQSGSSKNTNGPGLGLNTVLTIELDGTSAGPGISCLNIAANNTTVQGLVINRCTNYDITITSGTNNVIQGCFLGTNAAGNSSYAGKDIWGIAITAGTNDVIGGTTPDARNLIGSPSGGRGIEIGDGANTGYTIQGNLIGINAAGTAALPTAGGFGISLRVITNSTIGGLTPAAGNVISGTGVGIAIGNSYGTGSVATITIQGNLIGTDVTGTKVIGNTQDGIDAYALSSSIGGTAAGAGNVISGNGGNGVGIFSGTGTVVQGNFIGTDSTGALDLGNKQGGVYVAADNCVIGGINPGEANVIAYNGGTGFAAGVTVFGQHATIRGNSIFGTKPSAGLGLGIDLGGDGVTLNDACDGDSGANGLQNYPVLTSVSSSGGNTVITGTLNSKASTLYTIDFYSNSSCSGLFYGEGQTYLGSTTVTTDGSCNGSFSMSFPVTTPPGYWITATATDPSNNTSEFSACVEQAIGLPTRLFVSTAGDDANDCSVQHPCRTFDQAIAGLGSGGEIVALKSGGYGPFTIDKAVSILIPAGVYAGITAFSGSAITVAAGPQDLVVLKNLTINSLGGTYGVRYVSGGSLLVESCFVSSFFSGIRQEGPGTLSVRDGHIRNSTFAAIELSPSTPSHAAFYRCRLENGSYGLYVNFADSVELSESVVSGNTTIGIACNAGDVTVDDCLLTKNNTAISVSGGTLRLSDSCVTDSVTGLAQFGGALLSRTNNTVEGNTTNESGTIGTFTPK
jgi:Right handed beta helix region